MAWIAERKDVLSTLFWFLALLAHARYSARPDGLRLAGVVVLSALGLMTKPMLVTLPLTLLLVDFWPLGACAVENRERESAAGGFLRRKLLGRSRPGASSWPDAWPLVREKAPLFALAAASAVITLVAQAAGGAIRTTTQVPIADRAANAALSAAAYLAKTVWPSNLGVFYPLRDDSVPWGAAAFSYGY